MFLKKKSIKATFLLVFIKFLIINYNPVNFSLSYKTIVLFFTFLVSLYITNLIYNETKPKYIKLVLGLFYLTFFLLNELIFYNPLMVINRKWDTSLVNVQQTLSLGYFLFTISLLALNFGLNFKIRRIRFIKSKIILSHKWGVYLGVFFIIIGILGNIVLIGGIQNYIASIGNVFTYSDLYLERAESFETNLVLSLVLKSFMIPGTLLIYYSLRGVNVKKNILLISFLTIVLMIFNGVSGSRSDILLLIILISIKFFYNSSTFKTKYLLYLTLFFVISVSLAFYRDYSQLGREIDFNILLILFVPLVVHAITSYVTNFNGVYSLLESYTNEGLFKVDTIINQFSGLLGGASPLTSQQYYWQNLISENGSNLRLGLFIEFFMNYSYYGILLMVIVGLIIKFIGSSQVHSKNSIVDNTISVFLLYMLIFIVQANFSYLPRQLFYLSWPYIILHFIHVKKKNNSYSYN